MKTREEFVVRLLGRNDRSLWWGWRDVGGERDGEKLSDSGYILCVELIGIADGLNVAGERKKGIRDDSKIYGLNSGKKM